MAGFTGFDDLHQDPSEDNSEQIRRNAHVANGGESQFPCPACKGSGKFYSHRGRLVGNCFKCNGTGNVSKRQAAAAKAKVTAAANLANKQIEFYQNYKAEWEFICSRREHSNFYASMYDGVMTHGGLTDRQMEVVRRGMAEAAERREQRQANNNANSGEVDVSAIDRLFETAQSNGLKKLAFRTDRIKISVAPATGRNAGSLYVFQDEQYAGKITSGRYIANNAADGQTLTLLQEIAANPSEVARMYGKKTGICCCCGRELTDQNSIDAGIGPICASKWGL